MPRGYFITGTDTNVGKTYFACALLRGLQEQGIKACGLKPVASGVNAAGVNDDALELQTVSSLQLPMEIINPYVFPEPIAPHIAAAKAGVKITIPKILQKLEQAYSYDADCYVIEGAGGWLVPLNSQDSFADLAKAIDLPVILVVAIKLGCINHALLTMESMQQSGIKIFGWVANIVSPTDYADEIISTLQQKIITKYLGTLTTGVKQFLLPSDPQFV